MKAFLLFKKYFSIIKHTFKLLRNNQVGNDINLIQMSLPGQPRGKEKTGKWAWGAERMKAALPANKNAGHPFKFEFQIYKAHTYLNYVYIYLV